MVAMDVSITTLGRYICSSSSIRPLYRGVQLLVRPITYVARYAVGYVGVFEHMALRAQVPGWQAARTDTRTRAGTVATYTCCSPAKTQP